MPIHFAGDWPIQLEQIGIRQAVEPVIPADEWWTVRQSVPENERERFLLQVSHGTRTTRMMLQHPAFYKEGLRKLNLTRPDLDILNHEGMILIIHSPNDVVEFVITPKGMGYYRWMINTERVRSQTAARDMNTEREQLQRLAFMNHLYTETNADEMVALELPDIASALNINLNDADRIFRYLSQEGLAAAVALGNMVGITHKGIVEVEATRSKKPTEHFPYNVVMYGGSVSVFDQREQHVNYQYNAAGDINISAVQNTLQLADQLEKLRDEGPREQSSGDRC